MLREPDALPDGPEAPLGVRGEVVQDHKGKDIAGIQVFNLQGEKMLDVKGINEENNVSLKNLSSGTYVVLITLQNGKQSYSKIVLSD